MKFINIYILYYANDTFREKNKHIRVKLEKGLAFENLLKRGYFYLTGPIILASP